MLWINWLKAQKCWEQEIIFSVAVSVAEMFLLWIWRYRKKPRNEVVLTNHLLLSHRTHKQWSSLVKKIKNQRGTRDNNLLLNHNCIIIMHQHLLTSYFLLLVIIKYTKKKFKSNFIYEVLRSHKRKRRGRRRRNFQIIKKKLNLNSFFTSTYSSLFFFFLVAHRKWIALISKKNLPKFFVEPITLLLKVHFQCWKSFLTFQGVYDCEKANRDHSKNCGYASIISLTLGLWSSASFCYETKKYFKELKILSSANWCWNFSALEAKELNSLNQLQACLFFYDTNLLKLILLKFIHIIIMKTHESLWI